MDTHTQKQSGKSRSEARARYYKAGNKQYIPRSVKAAGESEQSKPKAGMKERMVLQACICGGILAILLLFSVVDSEITNTVTNWIGRNISRDMLGELGIFGMNDGEDANGEAIERQPMQGFAPNAETLAEPPSPRDSRIDEGILREIRSRIDVYYETNRD